MKKISILLGVFMLAFTSMQAQYWQYPNPNANMNPSSLNTDIEEPFGNASLVGWDSLQAPSATPVWSTTQNLPFAFNFNGAAVTQYKVSTTGVLTFDVATALAAPSATPVSLPSALIPNNSICAWGIVGTGANDKIITKTFGTAPNRQFWVSYSSYSHPSNASIYSYWSFVLDETTNKIHIVDQRTSGVITISAGLQFSAASAMMVAGSPALGSLTNGGATDLPDDNTYYSFIPGVQPANDILADSVSALGYYLSTSTQPILFRVKNIGASPITSYTMKYQDGANPVVSQNVTGVNIASFGTNTATFTTQLATTLGTHNIKVWAELAGDATHNNDSTSTKLVGVSSFPKHILTLEEPTGTWCGWCVRGIVYMDSIAKAHPNDVIAISVHNNDPMTVTAYDAGVGPYIGGYPSLLADRRLEADPSQAFDVYNAMISNFAFATVSATQTFNSTARTLNVTASITPALNMTGDYRLALVPIENRVHSTAGGNWNQNNYYASGQQGNATTMKNSEYNFNTLASSIPSATMYYDFVARDIIGGFNGAAGSLPATMNNGQTYTYTFPTYTIPATYDMGSMKYAVLLIDNTSATAKPILNAAMGTFYPLGVSTIAKNNIMEINAYPNPVFNNLNLDLNIEEDLNAVSYQINDMLGNVIATSTLGNLNKGAHSFSVNTTNFSAGMYSITVHTNKGTYTNKFSKN